MNLYIKIMGMEHREGRADVAQKLHSVSKKHFRGGSSSRGDDVWSPAGWLGIWRVSHRRPRINLCTPWKMSGGPVSHTKICKTRITIGKFVDTGENFKITDDWTQAASAHRKLKRPWVGETHFTEEPISGASKEDRLEESSDEEEDRCDRQSRENKTLHYSMGSMGNKIRGLVGE